jgi:hypothetical protein
MALSGQRGGSPGAAAPAKRPLVVLGFVGADGAATPSEEAVLAAALCNDARILGRHLVGDPVDVALLHWVREQGGNIAALRGRHPRQHVTYGEAMTVVCRFDGILREYGKGAPEAIRPLTAGYGFPASIADALEACGIRNERGLLLAGGPLGRRLPLLALLFLGVRGSLDRSDAVEATGERLPVSHGRVRPVRVQTNA